MLLAHLTTMARYNAWANERVLAAAAELTDADYWVDAGAFFKSVGGTLNHLIVTDRIWMQRFTGEGQGVWRLDEIVWRSFKDLADDRTTIDRSIIGYTEGLDQAGLQQSVRFKRVSTDEIVEMPRAPLMAHMFNHQTHHRGQIHAVLTKLVGSAPELDLLVFLRSVARAAGN